MVEKKRDASRWENPAFVESAKAARIAANLTRGKELRSLVQNSRAFGTFQIELPLPGAVNGLALAGFDFLVLDLEHSSTGFAALQTLISAAHAAAMPALVRPWCSDHGLIGKVLDMGANGVMAPHVDSVEKALHVVNQARFAPAGERGFSPIQTFDALRRPLEELNEATYVVCQIEGRDGLSNAGEIASVPGVDAIFVGPYDLALSMGLEPGSEAVFDAARQLAEDVPDSCSLGIYIDDPGSSGKWASLGFTLQCVSFDGRMFAHGARQVVEDGATGTGNIE